MVFLIEMLTSHKFWLPEGVVWEDLENFTGDDAYRRQAMDVMWSIPLGFVLFLVRLVSERFIFTPFGYWLGVKETKKKTLAPNQVLEAFYLKKATVQSKSIESIAKQTDISVREVERWLRDRKKIDTPGTIQKFRENGWLLVCKTLSVVGGLLILWKKPFLWKSTLCYKDWPNQDESYGVYYYVMINLAFNWCLVFSLLTDHRRKDFYQSVVHHIVAIYLMNFSWVTKHVRIGALVILVQDTADISIAAAKMFTYARYKKTSDVLFYVFIVVWLLSRMWFYPFVVLYSIMFEIYDHIKTPCPAFYLTTVIAITLQVLHVLWTYFLAKAAWIKITTGDMIKDARSDDSDSD